MGKNNKIIKNLGKNYSIDFISREFNKELSEIKPIRFYEKERYFLEEKIKKYNRKESIHDNKVKKIYNNPSLIGINDNFYNAEMEVPFFRKQQLKGSADVLIETKNNIYCVEYKTNHTGNNKKHAKKQLRRAKEYIKKNFGTDITKLLYVSGNFHVEEIVPSK